MLGSVLPYFRLPDGAHHGGTGAGAGDVGGLGGGYGEFRRVGVELEGALEDWQERVGGDDDGEEVPVDEADIGLEDFLDILQEDPALVSEGARLLGPSPALVDDFPVLGFG